LAIVPLPDTPVGFWQVLSEYNVKVTKPVGAVEVVLWSVAVSPTVEGVPTVMNVGDACVVMLGLALMTVSCSLAAPQVVVKPLLLASPA
jgi:hypothetical protein